jgi:hypothetical protein
MLAPKFCAGQLPRPQVAPPHSLSVAPVTTQVAAARARPVCSLVTLHGIGVSVRAFVRNYFTYSSPRNEPLSPTLSPQDKAGRGGRV